MLLLIPLLPFLGFLTNFALGRRLSKAVSGGLACAAMFGAFVAAAWSFWTLLQMPADTFTCLVFLVTQFWRAMELAANANQPRLYLAGAI